MFNKLKATISKAMISFIDASLEDLPENADQFLRLAIMKHQTGDLSGAVEAATTAIRNEPGNGAAFHWRSRAQYDLGETTRALHDALRDSKLRCDHAPTWYLLGNIFLRIENYVEARDAYARAIDLGDRSAIVYAGRGYAYYGLNTLNKALDDLETAKVLGFDSDDLTPYIENLKLRLGSTDDGRCVDKRD